MIIDKTASDKEIVLKLVYFPITNLNNSYYLSSAFGTLEFNTITDRLKNIGLKDIPLLWFNNFLYNRRFTIKINNSIASVQHPIKHGFPIQHIFNKYPDVNYNLYTDDIELHSNIESSDQLQNCLTDLYNWLTTNDLLMNSTKTELINISTTKLNIEPAFPKIFINDIPIKPSNSTKYLGIKFDNKLTLTNTFSHCNRQLPTIYTTYINSNLT